VGGAVSFPDPVTGGEFDAGFYGTLNALGKDYGIGRGTFDLGINKCSVVDLAGKGGQVSGVIGNGGAFINVDEDGNVTGGGVSRGWGYNIGGQAQFTAIRSIRHGLVGPGW